MATRKTPARTVAGKTAAKSTSATRKRSAVDAAAAAAKPRDTATDAPPSPMRATRKAAAMSPEERYRAIAHAAYLRAEKRGFAPGHEVDDWLAAEAEVDAGGTPAAD